MKCRLRPRVRRSGATHLAGVVEGPDFVRVQWHRLPELVRVVVRAQQASRGLAAEPDLRLGGASRGGDARGDRGDYAEREQREHREHQIAMAEQVVREVRARRGDRLPFKIAIADAPTTAVAILRTRRRLTPRLFQPRRLPSPRRRPLALRWRKRVADRQYDGRHGGREFRDS